MREDECMPSKKVAPPGYFTAQDAMREIGIRSSTFYNIVRKGEIQGVVPPGKHEAVYPQIEIKRFARAYNAFMNQFNASKIHFDLALPDDIEEIRAMVARESGGEAHTVPAEIMRGWMRRNNQALHILRRGTDIVGYISMFPLPLDTIIKRMTGEYWNRSIPLEDVQPYRPHSRIRLYIAESVVDQRLPDHHKLGLRLILETKSFMINLAREDDITIEEAYAVATTPFGISACKKLKMEPMTELSTGVREDRIPYRLDVASSMSHLFTRYREQVTT
jgi:hypothetical protein